MKTVGAASVNRRTGIPMGLLVLAMSLGGCGAFGKTVEQAAPERDAVGVDVKRALIGSDAGGAAIRVVVDESTGTVTLDGFVESEQERTEALRLAREASGGVEVVDALEIRD